MHINLAIHISSLSSNKTGFKKIQMQRIWQTQKAYLVCLFVCFFLNVAVIFVSKKKDCEKHFLIQQGVFLLHIKLMLMKNFVISVFCMIAKCYIISQVINHQLIRVDLSLKFAVISVLSSGLFFKLQVLWLVLCRQDRSLE